MLTAIGISVGTAETPALQASPNYTVPRWRSTDTSPRPTGSVWNKITAVNLGSDVSVKRWSSATAAWSTQSTPIYQDDASALKALDPSGGGLNIPLNTLYVQYNTNPELSGANYNDTLTLKAFERYAVGQTRITGSTTSPTVTSADQFTIQASSANSDTLSAAVTVTISGNTSADFVAAVSAVDVTDVSAEVGSDGAITFVHAKGGDIVLNEVAGTPLTDAGFTTSVTGIRAGTSDDLILSNWKTLTYSASATAPDQNPASGQLWYYSSTSDVDVMIQDGGAWKGYKNVSNDMRGFNLTTTNATGVIVAATAPTTQNDASQSPLVYGDLWLDSSDLENYPKLYRWESVESVNQWVLVDNTDQTTTNGILFADARWAENGTTDPVSGNYPSITTLLTSDYLDIDAPDPTLYAEGTLLFNTRRSGFNVKRFETTWFNTAAFNVAAYNASTSYVTGDKVVYNSIIYVATTSTTGNLPTDTAYWATLQTNAWVTANGNKSNGAPYMGRHSQRQLVVSAMKAAIDSQDALREEQNEFNLISSPNYPELMSNMVALNNERQNTAFIVGDTPMRLPPAGSDIVAWANDGTEQGFAGGTVAGGQYSGIFYPSCQTTDLSGSPVVQPSSHMMLRTIVRNDEVAYPWLAPAGVRRGTVDNATSIGYIDATTGEFTQIATGQGLRDTLYENKINPITFIPGTGITNYGNKTEAGTASALDRINVARLVAFIRGRLDEIGKGFVFEPNDQITRNEIFNAVNGLMIDLVAKRGLYDYLVVCDETNNTPSRIDRNELYVDVAIEPVKAVEFIYIPIRIKNTGEIESGEVASSGAV